MSGVIWFVNRVSNFFEVIHCLVTTCELFDAVFLSSWKRPTFSALTYLKYFTLFLASFPHLFTSISWVPETISPFPLAQHALCQKLGHLKCRAVAWLGDLDRYLILGLNTSTPQLCTSFSSFVLYFILLLPYSRESLLSWLFPVQCAFLWCLRALFLVWRHIYAPGKHDVNFVRLKRLESTGSCLELLKIITI